MEIFKIFHLFGFGILFHPDHHLLGTELTPELHLKEQVLKVRLTSMKDIHKKGVEYLISFGHELAIIIVTKSSILRVTKSPHLVKTVSI